MLQLVQALKFECTSDKTLDPNGSSLAQFLIDRATSDPILGTFFYWYVIVECEDLVCGKLYAKVAFHYIEALIRVSCMIVSNLLILYQRPIARALKVTREGSI